MIFSKKKGKKRCFLGLFGMILKAVLETFLEISHKTVF